MLIIKLDRSKQALRLTNEETGEVILMRSHRKGKPGQQRLELKLNLPPHIKAERVDLDDVHQPHPTE